MILKGNITINGKSYQKGDYISPLHVYPFFLIHMFGFGYTGFTMAYSDKYDNLLALFLSGGLAIAIYIAFYLTIFGREEVKWLFINACLGLVGIYIEIDWLLSLFDKSTDDYPWYRHIVPFLYYILYTFLIRQAILNFFGADEDENRKFLINFLYVIISLTIYALSYFLQN